MLTMYRVFPINREDATSRKFPLLQWLSPIILYCPRLMIPETTTPTTEIRLTGSKATVGIWAPLSDYILTGHENGKVAKYDAKTGEQVEVAEGYHSKEITDIQLSPDGTYFITSSRDKTARVGPCLLSPSPLLSFKRSMNLHLLACGHGANLYSCGMSRLYKR